jgi:hypothetical protein
MKITFLSILITLFLYVECSAQQLNSNDLVQFSGVVVTGDSLQPVPFTSIMIKNNFRGTVSDYFGFFSFVAKMRDTVEFSAIGFKKTFFVIPDTLTDNRCSLIQILKRDTILLHEVRIYPWPTKEQFKEAFISLRLHDDDMERAKKNLDPVTLSIIAENTPMDGSMNFRNLMQQQSSRLYYSGQLPPMNILNPVKWAQFIQAWQNGDFKKKEIKNDDGQ